MPQRFVPCGREYKRDKATFEPGPPELCRDPRYCPHCERILELSEELRRTLTPIREITVPADALDSTGLGDTTQGRVGLLQPGAIVELDYDTEELSFNATPTDSNSD